jgi:hypothetical protein
MPKFDLISAVIKIVCEKNKLDFQENYDIVENLLNNIEPVPQESKTNKPIVPNNKSATAKKNIAQEAKKKSVAKQIDKEIKKSTAGDTKTTLQNKPKTTIARQNLAPLKELEQSISEPPQKKSKFNPKEYCDEVLQVLKDTAPKAKGKILFYNVDTGKCVIPTPDNRMKYVFYEDLYKQNKGIDKNLRLCGYKNASSQIEAILKSIGIRIVIKPSERVEMGDNDEFD